MSNATDTISCYIGNGHSVTAIAINAHATGEGTRESGDYTMSYYITLRVDLDPQSLPENVSRYAERFTTHVRVPGSYTEADTPALIADTLNKADDWGNEYWRHLIGRLVRARLDKYPFPS